MKVVVLASHQSVLKEPYLGGLESFTHLLCESLLGLKNDVYLIAPKGSVFNGRLFEIGNESVSQYYHKALRLINKINPEIIHNNSLSEYPIIWAYTNKKNILTTLHTPLYSRLKSAISLYGDSDYQHFVTPSKHMTKAWENLTHSKNFFTIPNGIPLEKWKYEKRVGKYFLWYGRITPHKGTDIAIKAALKAQLPIKIAGPVGNKEYFEKTLTPYFENQNIDYLGHLTQKEINQALVNSYASVICPTWNEPFGLSTIESIASGTKVIGFHQGAFPEIVNEATGIICERKTIKSLSLNMLKSVDSQSPISPEERKAFCIKSMTHKYTQLYEECLQ